MAVAESFSEFGSIGSDTFAIFVKKVPGGEAGSVWKTIVNVAEVPDVRVVASEQLTVPVTAPGAGSMHENAGPLV